MTRKKTSDPALIALHEKASKARTDFERWYTKLKAAFNRMERARQRLLRLERKIRDYHPPGPEG
jgi:hypothetical protein